MWVAVDAGTIFLSMGTGRIGGKRLDMAATIYGLSPAQKQVAALIAEGLSLTDIAERMRITPNTARTHLSRIFDKTGVRTQPAWFASCSRPSRPTDLSRSDPDDKS